MGHNENITFGRPYRTNGELRVDATLHAACKYLGTSGRGNERAVCKAHGFIGPLPRTTKPDQRAGYQIGPETFVMVEDGRVRNVEIHKRRAGGKKKHLPVLQPENPCLSAKCRTSDNRVGAACCRDLKLELVLAEGRRKEALIRARKPPYVCKFEREDEDTVEVEVISACGYLGDDGVSCVLHDMARPNGKSAKPELCYDWPELDEDEQGHPGCVFNT